MLFLLSPAKSLDYVTPSPVARPSTPQFVAQSAELIDLLRPRSAAQIARLMDLSAPLAELNVARYAAWRPRFTAKNSKPALLAFNGDVYEGLQATTLNEADLRWAQQHVVILSGLYGVLRPLDRMQPYRLEMGTALRNPHGKDLYAFWGDTITEHLNERLARSAAQVVVNLASQEYFKVVRRKALNAHVIDCVFEDWKNGQYKIIGFFAKRARGLMARYAVNKRLSQPSALKKFNLEGYAFAAAASEPDRLVFRRRVDEPSA